MRRIMMSIILLATGSVTIVAQASENSDSAGDGKSTLTEVSFSRAITSESLHHFQNDFAANPTNRLIQNAVTNVDVDKLAINRELLTAMDHSFSNTLDTWKVTNQKSSGRCWLFAGCNLLRADSMKLLNLKNFEFSQNYLMFWDKLEKANYFLEAMIELAGRPVDDRTVAYLLSQPISDGGQWNMFTDLVKKHGMVPKSAMPETQSSSASRRMNRTLQAKLRESAKTLRDLYAEGATPEDLNAKKNEIMTVVYRILSIHLGNPPESFDWQWRDDKDEFHRDGRITPQQFAKKYIDIPFDQYICLVDDPRKSSPKGRTFTVEFLGNVVGGNTVKYLNIDINQMKKIAMDTIVRGEPVWFGCDTGKMMERVEGVWDKNLFDYEGIYNTTFSLAKADRLLYKHSAMTHAMLFTGVDIVDGKPRRWRVENSWGADVGKEGFFLMNDSWFDEYVFEIAARKDSLPKELQEAFEQDPIVLPAWDPMGSLAR